MKKQMVFLRGSILLFICIGASTCFYAPHSFCAEEVVDSNKPISGAEEILPEPTLGDDSLPVPSTKEEDSKYQVNTENLEDDVYLPPPTMQDTVTVSPQLHSVGGTISNSFEDQETSSAGNRPAFSLGGGIMNRVYNSAFVTEPRGGLYWNVFLRFLNVSEMAFLYFYVGAGYVPVGDIFRNNQTDLKAVRESVLTLGPILEVAVGRRFSLLGGLLRRSSTLKAQDKRANLTEAERITALSGIKEDTQWLFGIGAQYDFYVIPHGSFGARAYLESGLFTLGIIMSVEPVPQKRMNLDNSGLE